MSSNKQDQLLEHDSDGIQEYDNDLPKWWVYLFLFTIVWSGVYVVSFHFMGRPLPTEELAAEMAAQAPTQPSGNQPSENINWAAIASDDVVRKKGHEIFVAKCAACHLNDGGGLVGPNLTDQYWLHGNTPTDIYKVISHGVPEKGMIAWNALLKPDEIKAVTVHILSLQGTKPEKPKAPQGTKYGQ